ncbi:hypothetical protein DSM100688_0426 [Bifidobacterium ramosum]|uniref:HTH cro/C1-type domain-containing protein n=1 Tax=Bifidobacterium ramosum TaxID=1798158 RepID=A0A6L4X3N0_9BIFI|nr:helix-turn-helix transcriptional regulator [Bifidobacterium ramosum]KAB8289346.1 hypothetical protein DSM100688_0426 [Bifidobacterium ramosum]NEG71044.1 hypothetical protein [Bifidobacterium ramosum]
MVLNERMAERARAIMAAQGISVATYAEKTGQSVDMASRRLNGNVTFSLTDVEKFAKLTGYKPVELIDDEFVLKPTHSVKSVSPALADGGVK